MTRASSRRLSAALCGALLLAGCAAIPWPRAARSRLDAPLPSTGLRDLRGVVHVHTRGSHDSPGTVESVVRAAEHAGLAWVALTEHMKPGTIAAHGRIGSVTVLPGFEVRAARGSILAIGVAERPPRFEDRAELVRWIHDAGGAAFLGHIERSRLVEPEAYRRLGLDGIELVNLHAVALDRSVRLAVRAMFLPAPLGLRTLLQTPHANLERWAALPEARAIVGGVDAHARYRVLGPLGGNVDRYRDVFRLLTTHVLAAAPDTRSVVEALRAGRSYVAFEGLGEVDAFRFEPVAGGYTLQAPQAARLALVCDGVEVASLLGEQARLTAPAGARRCRAEAWLGERLWIITSYREVAAAPAPGPVSYLGDQAW